MIHLKVEHLIGALAQHHGFQGCFAGIHLQNGDVIVLLAANDLGIVGSAIVEGDGDAGAAADDMVVGDDVAVGSDDEAGAGAGALDGLTEEVIAGGGDVDAYAAVHVGGVDLRIGELFAALDADGANIDFGTVADGELSGRCVLDFLLNIPSGAEGCADHKRSGENACYDALAAAAQWRS